MGPIGRKFAAATLHRQTCKRASFRFKTPIGECAKTIVLFRLKIEAPGSGEGSRALEQPSPRTAHGANVGGLVIKIKET